MTGDTAMVLIVGQLIELIVFVLIGVYCWRHR